MSQKRIKVVNIISAMKQGGAQEILLHSLRYFKDSTTVDFSLYVLGGNTGSKYDQLIGQEALNVTYVGVSERTVGIKGIRRLVMTRRYCRAINQIILREKPDIVHFHISDLLAHAWSIVRKNHSIVFFDTLHSDPYRYNGFKLAILKRCFNQYGVVPICVTDFQEERAREHYALKKTELVRNGIPVDELQKGAVSQELARRILNLPQNAYMIGAVGRLNPIKRFDFLIVIFSLLKKQKENAVLVFAGSGAEQRRLEQLAKDYGVEDSVVFLGMIDHMENLYSAIDVLAVTSSSESCSLAALEAQSLGKRCVISSGVPDSVIVTDRVCRMPQNAGAEDWVEALLGNRRPTPQGNRTLMDYHVETSQKHLEELYLQYAGK